MIEGVVHPEDVVAVRIARVVVDVLDRAEGGCERDLLVSRTAQLIEQSGLSSSGQNSPATYWVDRMGSMGLLRRKGIGVPAVLVLTRKGRDKHVALSKPLRVLDELRTTASPTNEHVS